MTPLIVDGWLVVSYDGSEATPAYISLGGDWLPAYLDYHDGRRVAKVRPPATRGVVTVQLRAGGVDTKLGSIRL